MIQSPRRTGDNIVRRTPLPPPVRVGNKEVTREELATVVGDFADRAVPGGIDGEHGQDAPFVPGRDGINGRDGVGIPGQDGENGGDFFIQIPLPIPATVLFNNFTDTTTTHTDGTEDDLYSYTTAGYTLARDGDSIEETEHLQVVGSATAARRIKKYFAGTLIFDSGSLTLTLGGDFTVWTTIIRESAAVVRCTVSVTTTSASTVPYSTYTRITGLTLTGSNILKTTGIASGAGAASGDIVNKLAKVWVWPAAAA